MNFDGKEYYLGQLLLTYVIISQYCKEKYKCYTKYSKNYL